MAGATGGLGTASTADVLVASGLGTAGASAIGAEAVSETGTDTASEPVAEAVSEGGAGTASETVSEATAGTASETVVTSDGSASGASCVAAELASALRVVAACDIAASIASRLGGADAAGEGLAGGTDGGIDGSGGRIPCWTSGSLALMRAQMPESGSTGSTIRCSSPNRRSHSSTLAAKVGSASSKLRACARSSTSRLPSTYSAASASMWSSSLMT